MWTNKPFDSHQPRMFRILFTFSIITGLELLVRYLMQYQTMCHIFTQFAFGCKCSCQPNIQGNENDLFSCQSKSYNSSDPNSTDTSICPYVFQEIGLDQYPSSELFIQLLDSTFIFILLVLETQVSYNKSNSAIIDQAISDTTNEVVKNDKVSDGEQKKKSSNTLGSSDTTANTTKNNVANAANSPVIESDLCKSIQRMGGISIVLQQW